MPYQLNETHDPEIKSWVESANDPDTDFPLQNLPFGAFSYQDDEIGIGVRIGDRVLGLRRAVDSRILNLDSASLHGACRRNDLNDLMELGPEEWSVLRREVHRLLRADSPVYAANRAKLERCVVPVEDVLISLPADIGDYTDFYASVFHATNIGSMFRPDNPLLPNYKHIPIGYHGRASSIVVSGTPIRRPMGQTKDDAAERPTFGPCRLLDYELEVGFFVGPGNDLGEPIPIDRAGDNIFGLCLVNDWSARDLQKWEYQPLGPFLAKSFSTTISPWIVTMEALAPFRLPAFARPEGDPLPLPYLISEADQQQGGVDLTLEVHLASAQMRREGIDAVRLSRGSFSDMYWTIAQMLAHHASNGCNMRPGDLLASGTVSGREKSSRGCLMELTWRGAEPIELPTGEVRRFLQDGDEVVIRGFCEREGRRRIGFGECAGQIEG